MENTMVKENVQENAKAEKGFERLMNDIMKHEIVEKNVHEIMEELKEKADILQGSAKVSFCDCGEHALIVVEYRGMSFDEEGITLTEGTYTREITFSV